MNNKIYYLCCFSLKQELKK
ncbi:MAG: TRASH domain-containing protein [Malacoplasma sp.]|nr:TRASH domain-containing protein [Malacoplasma sp.]